MTSTSVIALLCPGTEWRLDLPPEFPPWLRWRSERARWEAAGRTGPEPFLRYTGRAYKVRTVDQQIITFTPTPPEPPDPERTDGESMFNEIPDAERHWAVIAGHCAGPPPRGPDKRQRRPQLATGAPVNAIKAKSNFRSASEKYSGFDPRASGGADPKIAAPFRPKSDKASLTRGGRP